MAAALYIRRAVALGMMVASVAPSLRAQSGKPLGIIVPFPPGRSSDIPARIVPARLGPALGQSVGPGLVQVIVAVPEQPIEF